MHWMYYNTINDVSSLILCTEATTCFLSGVMASDWLCAALWRENVESVLPKSLKEASHVVSPVMRPNWHAHIARCRTCHAGFRVWHWWLPPRVLDTQGQRGTWSYKPRHVYVAHMRCFWQCISERWDMMIYEILNKHKHSISNCVCSTHITRPPSRWPILVNNLGLALPGTPSLDVCFRKEWRLPSDVSRNAVIWESIALRVFLKRTTQCPGGWISLVAVSVALSDSLDSTYTGAAQLHRAQECVMIMISTYASEFCAMDDFLMIPSEFLWISQFSSISYISWR